MPVKVTKEEKMVELAILKAKEFLQHAGHLGTVELEDDSEDVKVKRPKENPKETKLDNPTGDGYGEVSGDAYHKALESIENSLDQLIKTYGGKYSTLNPSHSDKFNPVLDTDETQRIEDELINIERQMDIATQKLKDSHIMNIDPALIGRIEDRLIQLSRRLKRKDAGDI